MKSRNLLVLATTLLVVLIFPLAIAKDSTVAHRFPTWKTIELGTGLKTADDFRGALNAGGYKVGPWGNDLLERPEFKVSSSAARLDLVAVTVQELGLPHDAFRSDIYARAKEFGLELCPPEVGPQLRLQYPNQPQDEWLLIAMVPIVDLSGNRLVFHLVHEADGLWLAGAYGYPGSFWDNRYKWVFVQGNIH